MAALISDSSIHTLVTLRPSLVSELWSTLRRKLREGAGDSSLAVTGLGLAALAAAAAAATYALVRLRRR